MTKQEIADLKSLAKKIETFCNATTAHNLMSRSVRRRTTLLMRMYPNMSMETVKETIWKETNNQVKAVNLAYDEMRMQFKDCKETIDVIGWNSASPEVAFITKDKDVY